MLKAKKTCPGTGDPVTNICPICGKWDRLSSIAWEQATPKQRDKWDKDGGAPDNSNK